MIRHIVLWKIKESEDKQQNMLKMAEMLTGLAGKIEGLNGVEIGYNFNTNSEYDIVLCASLRNAAALKYYQNHPLHIECKDFINNIALDRTAVDYFCEEGMALKIPDGVSVNDPYYNSEATKSEQSQTIQYLDNEQRSLNFETPININEKIVLPEINASPDKAYHEENSFDEEPPVLESYNIHNAGNTQTNSTFSYIKNDVPIQQNFPQSETFSNTESTENNDVLSSGQTQNNSVQQAIPMQHISQVQTDSVKQFSTTPSLDQASISNANFATDISASPITQSTASFEVQTAREETPKSTDSENLPPVAPMRFSDNNLPPVAPMRFSDLKEVEKENENESKTDAQKIQSPAPVKEKHTKPSKKVKKIKDIPEITKAVNGGEIPDNYWKCPNCGKVMPTYVGTCGCGEVQPFNDPQLNTQETEILDASPVPMSESVAPVETPTEQPTAPVQEKRSIFGKKEKDVNGGEIPDSCWKCPSCGKVMPKYVGTCGCGEAQPFNDPQLNTQETEILDTSPVPMSESATSVETSAEQPTAPVQKKHSIFGKKEKNVPEITKTANKGEIPDNYWKCPNCGKVMPKYVGTCGCGESQPFEDFGEPENDDEPIPASNAWKCPKCGGLNSIFQRRCTSCGKLRPED